jgi:hypothetical protein
MNLFGYTILRTADYMVALEIAKNSGELKAWQEANAIIGASPVPRPFTYAQKLGRAEQTGEG